MVQHTKHQNSGHLTKKLISDYRIMFSISKIHDLKTEGCCISVVTPDTDIFVNLLYYLQTAWHGLSLYLLRKGDLKVKTIHQKELHPIHNLRGKLDSRLVRSLPPCRQGTH